MSDGYDFKSGQYPYPLNNVASDGGDFCKPFIEGDPTEAVPDEDNFYVICCTPEQMNKIISSIEVGAPIAFPDFYNDVMQLVDQANQFPNSFEGAPCVDICQMIIDCINDPESGVADAIYNLIEGNSWNQSREYGQSQNQMTLASGFNPECDLDILWAQCFGIVERMHEINLDMLAVLEVATNRFEYVADIVGDITLIDESSVDAFLQWVVKIQDSIAENYAAQAVLSYREERACQLFCLCQEDCTINPDRIFEIFNTALTAGLTIEEVIQDVFNYLVAGAWTGSEIADFMFMSQAAIRAMIGRLFDKIGWNDIDTIASLYTEDANDNWMVLCDECPSFWEHVWLGGEGNPVDDGWVIVSGTYDAAPERIIGATVGVTNYMEVSFTFSGPTTLTDISWTGRIKSPENARSVIIVRNASNAIVFEEEIFVTSVTEVERTLTWAGEQAVDDGWRVVIALNAKPISGGAICYVNSITVGGTDTDPFI